MEPLSSFPQTARPCELKEYQAPRIYVRPLEPPQLLVCSSQREDYANGGDITNDGDVTVTF